MCRKGKFNFLYRILGIIAVTGSLTLLPFISFAQDTPCNDEDPYNMCPLDTWVWVLVFAAMIFGAVQLYRRQKLQARA